MSSFNDPEDVARYAEGPVRMVPGFLDLQRMAALLLAERVPSDGTVLVLGAGGGLELKAFAGWYPGWRFVGVDPSAKMLDLATRTLGPDAGRALLHQGYIETAPAGPFDGATCLLTLHFVPLEERLRTLGELRLRLKPGAPLVVAHHSYAQTEPEKTIWLSRFAAFAAANGIAPELAQNAAGAISAQLPAVSPADDEELLRRAGFIGIDLFYAAFSFRGWLATAP
ncbi:MAG: methyltransferase [Alphaproteobacteria bacterium HGW-Alphaproteobacteria-4]|nr:MAG: methyltransferase [Alphaproteobacteria bacterium HGW-Alphaproteobacteria-4]